MVIYMVMNYKEALEKYKTKYNLNKAIKNKEIHKIDKGLYSFDNDYNYLDLLIKKYPYLIINDRSAFFYLGLTDEIPEKINISTKQKNRKIIDNQLDQTFESEKLYGLGAIEVEINNTKIKIYNKERMLIELIRNKAKYDYSYYKCLILEYRKIIDELDIHLLNEYLKKFKKGKYILKKLNEEVF